MYIGNLVLEGSGTLTSTDQCICVAEVPCEGLGSTSQKRVLFWHPALLLKCVKLTSKLGDMWVNLENSEWL